MSDSDEETTPIALAARVLAAQPFSVLVGAQLTHFGDGVARIEVPFRGDLLQQNGFIHGGVLAYAIDNAISFAAGTVLGTSILTAAITVAYHRPARGAIVATATVITTTRSSAAVRCEITSTDANSGQTVVVASGHGTVALVGRPDA